QSDVLSNPACGCDYPAMQPIRNNSAAPGICNPTCASNGGWSGSWTNEYPAAESGSVCGCNSCGAVTAPAALTNMRRANSLKP
ncbi:MAG: hypothetical protein ACRDD3_05640, partial [Azovibrio sp.]